MTLPSNFKKVEVESYEDVCRQLNNCINMLETELKDALNTFDTDKYLKINRRLNALYLKLEFYDNLRKNKVSKYATEMALPCRNTHAYNIRK